MAADGGYLRIAQAGFHEPADSLVPQIVKAEILKARYSLGIGPRFVERVGASYAISAGWPGALKNASSVSGGRKGLASDPVNTSTET
ncbi:hypothetical protein A3839_03360 [Achromobacter insolitus]|nr:hypothetical protein A3839_03360 [Achromobacter insolitus]